MIKKITNKFNKECRMFELFDLFLELGVDPDLVLESVIERIEKDQTYEKRLDELITKFPTGLK